MSLTGPRWQRHDQAVQEALTGPGRAPRWLPGEIPRAAFPGAKADGYHTAHAPTLFPGETEALSPSNRLGNRDTFLLTSGPPATAPQAEPGHAW